MRGAFVARPSGWEGHVNWDAIEGRRQASPMRLGVKQRHARAMVGPDGATPAVPHSHIAGLITEGLRP
jgi:hypothetical protein